ncbi:MAG: hypothetical protein Q4F72_03760 [Desulfovibrionaceae bacterium]|nr:hypothetical protein [Desulfovibrionaceae bacterium]
MLCDNFTNVHAILRPGCRIIVSNCHGKYREDGTRPLIGRFYPDATADFQGKGIVVFPDGTSSVGGEYGETWEVEVTRLSHNCLFARWVRKVGEWEWHPEFRESREKYRRQRMKKFGAEFHDVPPLHGKESKD